MLNQRWMPNTIRQRGKVAIEFVNAINDCVTGRSAWPLTLAGPTGTGKTCAALCLLDRVPWPTRCCSLAEFCHSIKEAEFGRLRDLQYAAAPLVTIADLIANWRKANFCMIDEIGTSTAKWKTEERYEALKMALDSRGDSPMIMTSNLTESELATLYDDRIASRIAGGTFVWVDADDRRLKRN